MTHRAQSYTGKCMWIQVGVYDNIIFHNALMLTETLYWKLYVDLCRILGYNNKFHNTIMLTQICAR